ncbi:MAG TPA: hypothetical protein VH682_31685 [Gemmataceae bacterium]|jgi:hypothetical protein
MDRTRFRAVISLAALLAVSLSGRAEEESRWPRSAEELQLSLTVVHALEDGPFVCKVKLKDVSKRALDYAYDRFTVPARCCVVAEWKAKKEPLIRVCDINGMIGPFEASIDLERASRTFYMHRSFLGVPAGDVPVRFGWDVYRTKKNPMKESDSKEFLWRPKVLQLLFSLQHTKTIKVLPATKENISRVLRILEADFARVALECAGRKDYHSTSDDPARDFVQTLGSCRHKEFVPLLLRSMDCLPDAYDRSELVRTVYDSFSTPEEGFNTLADYLASPRAAAAVEVFEYWKGEREGHEESKHRQAELRKKPKADSTSKEFSGEELMWADLQSQEDAWRTSKRHLDTRLTKEQFGRLRTMKNIWIRALLYIYFPKQCPDAWVRTLLTDLHRITHPPKHMQKLLAQLDDDRFEVRERATQELTDSRDAFAVYLGEVPKDKLSPEASRRLREVLQGLSRTELPPLPRRVFSHLAWSDKPEGRQILDILRKAEPVNLITRKAQDAFQERQKHGER